MGRHAKNIKRINKAKFLPISYRCKIGCQSYRIIPYEIISQGQVRIVCKIDYALHTCENVHSTTGGLRKKSPFVNVWEKIAKLTISSCGFCSLLKSVAEQNQFFWCVIEHEYMLHYYRKKDLNSKRY